MKGGMQERVVIHHQIHPDAVEDFIRTVETMIREKNQGELPQPPLKESYEEEGTLRKEMALGY